jgi:membrane protease YdiL (CAAX protease family)
MPSNLSPGLAIASLALLVAFGAILGFGPYVWYMVGRRLYQGESVLEHEPRRLASWGFLDLLAFVVLWIVFSVLIAIIASVAAGYDLFVHARADDDNRSKLYLMLIDSIGRLLSMAAVVLFVVLRTRCTFRDLGFSWTDLPRDLRMGAAAFCALAIPTYGLQMILTQFWKSEHPLIESLKMDRDPQFLAIALFAAVISAPLAEEFGFRVLFQGWLEKMFDPAAIGRPNFGMSLFAGERLPPEKAVAAGPEIIHAELAHPDLVQPEPRSIYLGAPPHAEMNVSPYIAPSAVGPIEKLPGVTATLPRWITDAVPIFASAAIFAVMHISHGPDFIPLLILAVGLGYLYRRTHRITPGLIVHLLLNLVSMLALCLSIYTEAAPTISPTTPVEQVQDSKENAE